MTHTKFVVSEGHPVVGTFCHGCGEEFQAGAHLTLIALGPGADPEERAKAAVGQPYTAMTIPVCWPCATGEL